MPIISPASVTLPLALAAAAAAVAVGHTLCALAHTNLGGIIIYILFPLNFVLVVDLMGHLRERKQPPNRRKSPPLAQELSRSRKLASQLTLVSLVFEREDCIIVRNSQHTYTYEECVCECVLCCAVRQWRTQP